MPNLLPREIGLHESARASLPVGLEDTKQESSEDTQQGAAGLKCNPSDHLREQMPDFQKMEAKPHAL
jgi:hypothetical protein